MNFLKKLWILILIFLLSGCNTNKNNMENINIYTTTYPINFLIKELYGKHAKIFSIYPPGVNLDEYELSISKL